MSAAGTRAAKAGPRTNAKSISQNKTGRDALKKTVRKPRIGVMNPYVLARIVMGYPGNIHPFAIHAQITEDDMVEAFKKFTKGKVQNFNDIFDPEKSPLFEPQNLHQYIHKTTQRKTKVKKTAKKMPAGLDSSRTAYRR